MGYNTDFSGELRFTKESTVTQLAKLNSMFGEDCRDHPEWNAKNLCYIDLELNNDFSGIRWNGNEKTYKLDQVMNVIINEMRKQWPDFGLTGSLLAQGEDIEDRWRLVIGADGLAYRQEIAILGKVVTCPLCNGKFEVE